MHAPNGNATWRPNDLVLYYNGLTWVPGVISHVLVTVHRNADPGTLEFIVASESKAVVALDDGREVSVPVSELRKPEEDRLLEEK